MNIIRGPLIIQGGVDEYSKCDYNTFARFDDSNLKSNTNELPKSYPEGVFVRYTYAPYTVWEAVNGIWTRNKNSTLQGHCCLPLPRRRDFFLRDFFIQ
jgi:hypothetical protein